MLLPGIQEWYAMSTARKVLIAVVLVVVVVLHWIWTRGE